jgi:hypothetical protein
MIWPAFTNPWLLAGLAAVGLPLLVHWLTRARPRRIPFPPFKFLVEACAGQQAVNRLRTILLLLVRCLLVAALALLFARPFFKATGAAANAQPARRVVLILDASLSMRAVQQGVPLFARAQAEAADVLRTLPSGSEAAVILEGTTPRPLLPALSENIPALHDLLVKSQPAYENGEPGAALALAQKMLNGNGTIHVFSDFQKSNWEGVRQLPGGLACRLHPVTTAAVDNVAVTAARLVPAAPVIGEPVEVFCTVFNCSPGPREETVRLELGEFTRETRVTLPPFGTTDAAFEVSFSSAGPVAGKVSLPPDNLPEDNTRFVAANVGKALEVALISDADDADWHSAAFYLSRALAPSPQAAPGIHLVRRRSQDLDRGVLETADVFCLAAPATLSGEALEIIARRVHEGARLISFLDGPTAPALVFPALDPPFELQHTVVSANGDSVTMGTRKLFGELEAGDFAALRFRRHFQNRTADNRAGDTLLAYPDGSAALTISPAGRGSLVLVNLPVTPDAGDFAGSPIFPALLHELLRALRRDSAEIPVTPGAAWTLDVPTTGEGAVTVTGPDGTTLAAQVLASGRNTRLALPPAKLPGVYSVKQADTVVACAVVNPDPRESDTRPLALDQLKPGANSAVTVQHGEEEVAAGEQAQDLWPRLAAAAAVLLGIEMLMLAFWQRSRIASGGVQSRTGAAS